MSDWATDNVLKWIADNPRITREHITWILEQEGPIDDEDARQFVYATFPDGTPDMEDLDGLNSVDWRRLAGMWEEERTYEDDRDDDDYNAEELADAAELDLIERRLAPLNESQKNAVLKTVTLMVLRDRTDDLRPYLSIMGLLSAPSEPMTSLVLGRKGWDHEEFFTTPRGCKTIEPINRVGKHRPL